jgi:hypothetical protein
MADAYTSNRKLPEDAVWLDSGEVFSYRDERERELFRSYRQVAYHGGNRSKPVLNEHTGKRVKRHREYWNDSPDHLKPPNARIIPYRLPELIKALNRGRSVYVVEGEPKADALWKLDLPATCNANGAGHWQAEHALFLRGAEVIILPDNDEPGRDHADQVGRSLEGLAKRRQTLALPDLPERGDVVDWLANGGTREALVGLTRNAPEWVPAPVRPVDLWAQFEPPPLPRGLLPKVIEELALEQGRLMGVDPAGLALAALTVCAAAIPDQIKLQPKRYDDNWQESAL